MWKKVIPKIHGFLNSEIKKKREERRQRDLEQDEPIVQKRATSASSFGGWQANSAAESVSIEDHVATALELDERKIENEGKEIDETSLSFTEHNSSEKDETALIVHLPKIAEEQSLRQKYTPRSEKCGSTGNFPQAAPLEGARTSSPEQRKRSATTHFQSLNMPPEQEAARPRSRSGTSVLRQEKEQPEELDLFSPLVSPSAPRLTTPRQQSAEKRVSFLKNQSALTEVFFKHHDSKRSSPTQPSSPSARSRGTDTVETDILFIRDIAREAAHVESLEKGATSVGYARMLISEDDPFRLLKTVRDGIGKNIHADVPSTVHKLFLDRLEPLRLIFTVYGTVCFLPRQRKGDHAESRPGTAAEAQPKREVVLWGLPSLRNFVNHFCVVDLVNIHDCTQIFMNIARHAPLVEDEPLPMLDFQGFLRFLCELVAFIDLLRNGYEKSYLDAVDHLRERKGSSVTKKDYQKDRHQQKVGDGGFRSRFSVDTRRSLALRNKRIAKRRPNIRFLVNTSSDILKSVCETFFDDIRLTVHVDQVKAILRKAVREGGKFRVLDTSEIDCSHEVTVSGTERAKLHSDGTERGIDRYSLAGVDFIKTEKNVQTWERYISETREFVKRVGPHEEDRFLNVDPAYLRAEPKHSQARAASRLDSLSLHRESPKQMQHATTSTEDLPEPSWSPRHGYALTDRSQHSRSGYISMLDKSRDFGGPSLPFVRFDDRKSTSILDVLCTGEDKASGHQRWVFDKGDSFTIAEGSQSARPLRPAADRQVRTDERRSTRRSHGLRIAKPSRTMYHSDVELSPERQRLTEQGRQSAAVAALEDTALAAIKEQWQNSMYGPRYERDRVVLDRGCLTTRTMQWKTSLSGSISRQEHWKTPPVEEGRSASLQVTLSRRSRQNGQSRPRTPLVGADKLREPIVFPERIDTCSSSRGFRLIPSSPGTRRGPAQSKAPTPSTAQTGQPSDWTDDRSDQGKDAKSLTTPQQPRPPSALLPRFMETGLRRLRTSSHLEATERAGGHFVRLDEHDGRHRRAAQQHINGYLALGKTMENGVDQEYKYFHKDERSRFTVARAFPRASFNRMRHIFEPGTKIT